MTDYRFDTGVSIKVRTHDSVDAEGLVTPFISWLDAKFTEFPGPLSAAHLADADQPTVIEARRDEGVTEVFAGDETEQALLSF